MSGRSEPQIGAPAQLLLVPLRNRQAVVVEDTERRLVVELEAVYPRWLGPLPRLLGAPRTRRRSLDGLSLLLWRKIDDRITLGALIDGLAADQQLTFNEARLLALAWLRSLAAQGLLVLGDRTVDQLG